MSMMDTHTASSTLELLPGNRLGYSPPSRAERGNDVLHIVELEKRPDVPLREYQRVSFGDGIRISCDEGMRIRVQHPRRGQVATRAVLIKVAVTLCHEQSVSSVVFGRDLQQGMSGDSARKSIFSGNAILWRGNSHACAMI